MQCKKQENLLTVLSGQIILKKFPKIILRIQLDQNHSSIVLGVLNPTLHLRCWDVMSFCMQLKINYRGSNIGEREGIREGEGRWKNHHFSGVHRVIRIFTCMTLCTECR